MKKTITIGLILALLISIYFLWQTEIQLSVANVSQITIKDLETKATQTFHLDPSGSKDLFADLNGSPEQALPDASLHAFELALQNRWGYTKNYMVYFDSQQNIFVKDMENNRLISVNNSAFFHRHEGFDSLYPYKNHPQVEWLSSLDKLYIKAQNRSWSFKRRDGNWYPTLQESTGAKGINKVTTLDTAISFQTDRDPSTVYLEVRNETGEIVLKQEIGDSTIPVMDKDGVYRYRIEMSWSQPDEPYKGIYSYEFELDVNLPAAFEISKLAVTQGEVIKIYIYNVNEDEVPMLNQKLFKSFRFNKSGTVFVGYLPTNYNTKPGVYEIEYGLEGGQMLEDTITVKARNFNIQHMTIDEKIDKDTRNDAANAEYNKYFKPSRLNSSKELYYSEPFVIPVVGRLSTEFGETRYVNGSPTSYRHSGLDIAAPTGTPVYAINRGKVVLSMFLQLTGNTIVIDHGQGLFSVYYHLHERSVETNILVERDQQIGIVGTTGFSTGPHLHFTMSYYDNNIEPGYFLVGEPITDSNYKKHLKRP